jgi:hypothetical protein
VLRGDDAEHVLPTIAAACAELAGCSPACGGAGGRAADDRGGTRPGLEAPPPPPSAVPLPRSAGEDPAPGCSPACGGAGGREADD